MNIQEKINSNAKTICGKLHNAGFESYVVGGAIRDIILGKVPKDFDIVSNASPDDIRRIFAGFNVLEMGAAFGIMTVVINGEPIEIAQMRKDGNYSDGRRPDIVEPVRDIEIDLARRDFTMNAIAWCPTREIIRDPFCGTMDILDHLISFVGEAEDRIAEDKLRILRAFRFMSQLGFELDENALNAIKKWMLMTPSFEGVSQERITAELTKIVMGKNAFNTIVLMTKIGLIDLIIPEFEALRIEHNCHWHKEVMEPFGNQIITHVLFVFKEACDRSDDLVLRLAALFHDIGKPACKVPKPAPSVHSTYKGHDHVGAEMTDVIMTRMKFPTVVIERVVNLVKHHMSVHDIPKMKKIHKIRRFLGKKDIDLMVLLGICDSSGSHGPDGNPVDNAVELLVKRVAEVRAEFPVMLPAPIVTGLDLIAEGLKPGPEFKGRLDGAFNLQLAGCEDKKKLIAHAKGLVLPN